MNGECFKSIFNAEDGGFGDQRSGDDVAHCIVTLAVTILGEGDRCNQSARQVNENTAIHFLFYNCSIEKLTRKVVYFKELH